MLKTSGSASDADASVASANSFTAGCVGGDASCLLRRAFPCLLRLCLTGASDSSVWLVCLCRPDLGASSSTLLCFRLVDLCDSAIISAISVLPVRPDDDAAWLLALRLCLALPGGLESSDWLVPVCLWRADLGALPAVGVGKSSNISNISVSPLRPDGRACLDADGDWPIGRLSGLAKVAE